MTAIFSRLFGTPGYSYLLSLRAISSIILWIDFTLMFSLLTYFWQANATVIGVTSALYGLPGLVLGPFFGRLADRTNPLTMLLCSYLARGITSFLLIFAPSIEVFVALIFLKGLANLGAMPAEQILVRSLLTREQIIANTSITTAIDQFIKILSPLIGALLAQYYAAGAGFGISTALSALGFAVLIGLRTTASKNNKTLSAPNQKNAGRFDAFFILLKKNVLFRYAFLCAIIQTAVLGFYDPLLALFLKHQGFPAGTFGTIVSCTAAGAILGAIIFRRIFSGSGGLNLIAVALTGFGATVFIPGVLTLCGLPVPFYVLCLLWVANGGFYGLASMSFGVILQTECPHEAIGVISSTARSVQLGVLVTGPLLGSALATASSIPAVFLLSGCAAILAGFAVWIVMSKDLVFKESVSDMRGN